jgi:NAD(P)-dependent dehydrogenase (short-subunit alcohol dehydrogenase family)
MPGQLAVLVTGASSGIGRATALEFARRGHRVFAAARTGSALAELSAGSPAITAVTMDVTDPASVRAGWAKIEAETGSAGVDVLVNNAGFALTGPLEVLTDEDIQRQFATNVFGLLSLTRIVLPGMRARRSGRIINISSVLGRFAMPGVGAYAATKYAVEALSDAMRQEVAGFGIKVVIMEPGRAPRCRMRTRRLSRPARSTCPTNWPRRYRRRRSRPRSPRRLRIAIRGPATSYRPVPGRSSPC